MASGSVFLLGGGWNEAAFPQTYGRFTAAVGDGAPRIACVLLDVIDRDAYFERSAAAFGAISTANVYPVFVSPDRPLRPADLVICSEDVSEDEEYLDIRPGLGLAPFAVDVHASQYGTSTRLLHAVRAGLVPEGWAIDEETMIELRNGEVTVSGLGSAYHVRKVDGQIVVDIHLGIDNRDVS